MVKKALPVVIWNKGATIYFKKAYQYIKQDSFSNAEKFKVGIIRIVDSLPKNPMKYPPDKPHPENAACKTGAKGLLIPLSPVT